MNYKAAIAIDFDGTITSANEYPNIGKMNAYAPEVIRAIQKKGYYCYLWTCRKGKELQEAKAWLENHDIFLDGYNEGPSTGSPKLVASVYIDDAAYPNNGNINWLDVAKYFGVNV